MFGLIKKRALWSFAVLGKHPAAGDFICLGIAPLPLVAGFFSLDGEGIFKASW